MQGVEQDLRRDVESYSCGEIPSSLEMLRAPRLEKWQVAVRSTGKEFRLVVRGEVHKHRDYSAGTQISTSSVAWFDRHWRWIRTHNRLYSLGQPAGDEGIDVPDGN